MKKLVVLATVLIVVGVVLCSMGTMYEILPAMLRHASLIGVFFVVFGTCIAGTIYENWKKAKYEETHIIRRL